MKPLTPDETLTANAYIALIERGVTTQQAKKFLIENYDYLPVAVLGLLIEMYELTPGIVVHDRRITIIARTIYRFLLEKKVARI